MMKKTSLVMIITMMLCSVLTAQTTDILHEQTYASFYADLFNGRPTASGEIYDMNAYTAAHKTLPFGSVVEVTNLENGRKVFVRINDRGPFVENREIDLSKAAAQSLDMLSSGIARVQVRLISLAQTSVAQAQPNPQALPNPQATQPTSSEVPTVPETVKTVAPATQVYVPTTPEETPGILWRIQLGAFSREENAMRLVSSLRKIGFEPAFEKTDSSTRVVLYGIKPSDLERIKKVLNENGFYDYIIRQESW